MPNHSICAVAVCRNTGRNETGQTVSYYQFPKDPTVCRQWQIKCKRQDSINVKYARICSVHFAPNDFERNLQYELLGITPRFRKLKKDAIPTLHLQKYIKLHEPSEDTSETADCALENASTQKSERQKHLERRTVRSSALERLANISPVKRKCDQATNTDVDDPEKVAMRDKIEMLEQRLKLMGKNFARIFQSKEELKRELQKCQRQLISKTSLISNSKQKSRSHMQTATSDDEFLEKHSVDIAKAASKIFTPRQLRHLIKNSAAQTSSNGIKKKTVQWEVEDIQSALELRAVSRRGYHYLRSKGYPLPCLSMLKNWSS